MNTHPTSDKLETTAEGDDVLVGCNGKEEIPDSSRGVGQAYCYALQTCNENTKNLEDIQQPQKQRAEIGPELRGTLAYLPKYLAYM